MTGRQRGSFAVSRSAMVDLLAWRRCVFVFRDNLFERSVMTTLLALPDLAGLKRIHPCRDKHPGSHDDNLYLLTQPSRSLDKPHNDLANLD